MTSLLICLLCFVVTFTLTRRSLVWGLAACIGLGYVFGVLKANILDTFSFLIWDASVLGLYASYFSRRPSPEEASRNDGLRLWVAALILWPVILTLVPVQYPLIQLVGLRANTFLLPFLLIGARLKAEEVDELALVQHRQNQGKLVHFFRLQASPDQQERQEERICPKADQLNQRILDGNHRKNHGPQNQGCNPESQTIVSGSLFGRRSPGEIAGVQAEHRRVPDQEREGIENVRFQNTKDVTQPDAGGQSPDQRPASQRKGHNET